MSRAAASVCAPTLRRRLNTPLSASPPPAFVHPREVPAIEVYHQGDELGLLAQVLLINGDASHVFERDAGIALLKVGFDNVLHALPAHVC